MAKDKEPSSKMRRKAYEKELRKLQVQLCHLQEWVKAKKLRVIVLFEGRDAAGKGGTIKAITEKVSPRVFRVVALPAPSDREKTQLFLQRYMQNFPAAGEIVIFDRSWYNRAGVEYVMGFCTPAEHKRFLSLCPQMEKYIIEGGIILIKLWLEVGMDEQERRFEARMEDARRQRGAVASNYFNRMVTPATAAESSTPTLGPLSCRITPLVITPLVFRNRTLPAPPASAPPAPTAL